jgi:hypothetical protein
MGLFQLALHEKCTEEFYNLKCTGSRIKMEVFILFYKYKGILRSSNVQIKEFVCIIKSSLFYFYFIQSRDFNHFFLYKHAIILKV